MLVGYYHYVMVLRLLSVSNASSPITRGRGDSPHDQTIQKIGIFKLETTNFILIRDKKVKIFGLCPPLKKSTLPNFG